MVDTVNMATDWKSLAAAKRDAILKSIPEKWRLAQIPSAEEQKDVTGPYIQQFLDKQEVDITETDAVGIAEKVAAGTWSAVVVTQAFCHRAALAHQLVSIGWPPAALTYLSRSIASTRPFLTPPCPTPKPSMPTMLSTRRPRAYSTACPSR